MHQKPQEQVPIHPVYRIQDWDDAPGAIVWPKMALELAHVKSTGAVSDSHYSHDHLNAQKGVPIEEKVFKQWQDKFREIESKGKNGAGEKVQWVIVDGFLLYWTPEVYDELDVRILLREPEPRVTTPQASLIAFPTFTLPLAMSYVNNTGPALANPEGSLWRDPPNYWENIVWPAYIRAHEHAFEGGDVQHGKPNGKIRDLVVLDGETTGMTELFDQACERIVRALELEQGS
ncbi:ribosylnicotinamide kinase [Tulasnella sp. 331]|nr:ribosylnicotinamide kinase [Tulasnella sp. 331]